MEFGKYEYPSFGQTSYYLEGDEIPKEQIVVTLSSENRNICSVASNKYPTTSYNEIERSDIPEQVFTAIERSEHEVDV